MHRCELNVWCLREIHIICLLLRSVAGACWRTCALLWSLAGGMLISAVLGSATCPFTHAQVRDERLMSKRNTYNMLAFAAFGGACQCTCALLRLAMCASSMLAGCWFDRLMKCLYSTQQYIWQSLYIFYSISTFITAFFQKKFSILVHTRLKKKIAQTQSLATSTLQPSSWAFPAYVCRWGRTHSWGLVFHPSAVFLSWWSSPLEDVVTDPSPVDLALSGPYQSWLLHLSHQYRKFWMCDEQNEPAIACIRQEALHTAGVCWYAVTLWPLTSHYSVSEVF